jgi:hypothetical protein
LLILHGTRFNSLTNSSSNILHVVIQEWRIQMWNFQLEQQQALQLLLHKPCFPCNNVIEVPVITA